MKKYSPFICLLLGLVSTTNSVSAQPILRFANPGGLVGSATETVLRLEDPTTASAGFNAHIKLPPGVTLTGLSKGALVAGVDFSLHQNVVGQDVKVLVYSKTGFFDKAGELLKLQLKVDPAAAAGLQALAFAETNENPDVNARHALTDSTGQTSLNHTALDAPFLIYTQTSDYDKDGMPDWWEFKYGLNALDPKDANGDLDEDGISNLDEYKAGTDPTQPALTPGAPTAVVATAGNALAAVSWTAPTRSGGSAITGYTVTSAPGAKTCQSVAPTVTCTVTGLTNGTAYTFTVTATNGHGTGPASAPSNSVTPTVPPIKPARRDFNVDGKGDLIWRHATTGQNRLWLMNGLLAPVAKAVTTVADGQWKIVASDDFDGDGKADLFWRHQTSGKNQVWLMNGNQVRAKKDLTAYADLNWQVIGAGDLNNDGKRDIIWRNVVTGANRAWLMNGIAAPAVKTIAAQANNWELVQVADFNGDGKADLFWRQKTTGENAVWLMNGNLVTTKKALLKLADANWQVVGSGDFNQDGVFDVMWRHATTGANRLWLLNRSATPTVKTLTALAGAAWKIAQVNDFDGDGKADLLWRNMTTGATSLWRMNGSQVLAKKALTREADLKWEVVR